MNFLPLLILLALAFLQLAVYRYGLVAALLSDHPGFLGMTVFTTLLFVPSILAFRWRAVLAKRPGIGQTALAAAAVFAALALVTKPGMGLMRYATNAFLLGMMEALLVPAVQGWFSHLTASGAGFGNAILWSASCVGLILSPIVFPLIRPALFIGFGMFGVLILAVLTYRISPSKTAVSSEPAAMASPAPDGARTSLTILFLTGAAVGVMSNMIYPIALRELKLSGWLIGLYAALPMVAATGGAWAQGKLGDNAERLFLPAFLVVPSAFLFFPHKSLLPPLLAWGVCLGYMETNRLCRQGDLNAALSAKYGGLAGGIVCSGLAAQLGASSACALGAGFYGTFLLGGVLWMTL